MDLYKKINQTKLAGWIKKGTIPATETFVTDPQQILNNSKPTDLILQVKYDPQQFYHEFFNSGAINKVYRTCTPVELGDLEVNVLSLGELAKQSLQ